MSSTRANHRQPQGRLVAAVSMVAVGLASCGASDPENVAGGDSQDGAEVFAAACASCHGADLRGSDKGPSQLSILYEPGHHTDASFRAAILNGSVQHHWNFGDMAAIEGLSGAEIDAVITFVRAQQAEHGFEPYPL